MEVFHDVDLKNIGEYHNSLLEKIVEDEIMISNASSFKKISARS